MTSYSEYRITYDGTTGPILTAYPGERWRHVCQVCDSRGGRGLLEERTLHDPSILQMLGGRPEGWMCVGELVIGPWRVMAATYCLRDEVTP